MSARWTWHGGGLEAAQRRFGHGPWIDLSTGINPHGWSGDAPIDWRRLPEEGGLSELEQAAAAQFGADPAAVCAVPGTELGLRLVGDLLAGPVAWVGPSYGTYAESFAGAWQIGSDDLARADGQSLLVTNPNNPDGRLLDRAALVDLLDRRGDGWLLLDEAFAEATPQASLADLVGGERRLIVFRSFGKFFGLAGLRLGFVLGPPAVLAPLRRLLGAWPVSAAAIAIGTAAYRDAAWIADMRVRLRGEATALDALLGRAGLEARGASPLFRLVEVGDGMVLFDRLGRHHILTRPFAQQPRWLRIGLPADAEASVRLEAALRG